MLIPSPIHNRHYSHLVDMYAKHTQNHLNVYNTKHDGFGQQAWVILTETQLFLGESRDVVRGGGLPICLLKLIRTQKSQ